MVAGFKVWQVTRLGAISGLVLASILASIPHFRSTLPFGEAAIAATSVQPDALLRSYQQAIAALPQLPTLQYRQQVQVSGSQSYAATLDVLYRRDSTWQAWVSEGDRARLLDSEELQFVNEGDVARLYSVYVGSPDELVVSGTLALNALGANVRATSADVHQLGDRAVNHLVLESNGGSQLQELWLDPQTHLPLQALLGISDRWGGASALVSFGAVDRYWMPQTIDVNLVYSFWTLSGLERRTFQGELAIRHDFQDYILLSDDAELPSFDQNRPPTGSAPAAVKTASTSERAGSTRAIGTDVTGQQRLQVNLQDRTSNSSLAERITTFNLTRPSLRNPLTEIDTAMTLSMGGLSMPLYLLQFDLGQAILPSAPPGSTAGGAGGNRYDPVDPTDSRQPNFTLFGN
ncbi:MAG: hypothetical protein AAF704_12115 [Cyanobacteria bacterium P01_D01_bin.123]